MGINDLPLTPELIAALYPETLVSGNLMESAGKPRETPQQDLSPAPVYPFLGMNKRSICFLVNYPDDPFIPDEQLAFIEKILTVCKCSMEDIALINTSPHSIRLEELKRQVHPEIIFLWGIRAATAGIKENLKEFSITAIDGISVIPVLTPELMNQESTEGKELKTRLWACLRKLFSL
jgi:hypothetical protein